MRNCPQGMQYFYRGLADSEEGAKERELSVGAQFIAPKAGVMNHAPTHGIKRGFVYRSERVERYRLSAGGGPGSSSMPAFRLALASPVSSVASGAP